MDVRHLRYFVSIADAGSFSKAATQLRVAQPALSRQIRDLERELGLRLFDRAERRVRLTPEGNDLLRRSRDALQVVETLRDRARSFESGTAGILRVGASPQVLQSVIAGFLPRYRRAHPGVEVELAEDGAVRVLDLVERGELQLALVTLPIPPTLHARVLFPANILAVIPETNALARRRKIELAELATEPLLFLRPGFATRQIIDGAFQAARIEPRVVLESGSPHCLLTFAEIGHGIALVPSTLLLPRGRFRVAPIVQGQAALGFWLAVCWHARRGLPAYGEQFVTELVHSTRRNYPGRQFTRVVPRLRAPNVPKAG